MASYIVMKGDKFMEVTRKESSKWFSALSINEQKAFCKLHPTFKWDAMRVFQVRDGVEQLYQYLIANGVIHPKMSQIAGDE